MIDQTARRKAVGGRGEGEILDLAPRKSVKATAAPEVAASPKRDRGQVPCLRPLSDGEILAVWINPRRGASAAQQQARSMSSSSTVEVWGVVIVEEGIL